MSVRVVVQQSGTADGNAQPRLLPPLELEVMKVLWKQGESSVAVVQTALQDSKPLAYTTVMTLLDRLNGKGAVTRRKQGRGFRYTPVFTREAVTDLAIERLVEDFFDNSRKELAAYLEGEPNTSPAAAPQIPSPTLAPQAPSPGKDPQIPSPAPAPQAPPPHPAPPDEQQESIDSVLL